MLSTSSFPIIDKNTNTVYCIETRNELHMLESIAFQSILVGILLGVFSGLIPGAGNLTTMLLFFPLLLTYDPIQLIVIYTCMASVSQFVGSVPAVLVGIPGESSSVPAVIEGHRMYKDGNGPLAIMGCAIGSWAGTFFAVGFTFLIAAHMHVVFQFYYAWVQALVFFLVTVVVILVSGNKPIVNFSFAVFGFFLGMIGYNIQLQSGFLTFGNSWLYAGLPEFVVILGIIAVPEILQINNLVVKSQHIKQKNNTAANLALVYKNKLTIVWSSVVGYIAGFIPGLTFIAGSNIAYYISKLFNRNKDPKIAQLNHLLAAETSNNVGAFSQLMPLIFLGIPIIGSEALLLSLIELKGYTFSVDTIGVYLSVAAVSVLIASTVGLFLSWPLSNQLVKVYNYTKYLPYVAVFWIIAIVLYLGYQDYSMLYYVIVFLLSVAVGLLLKNKDKIPIVLFLLLQDNILESFYRVYQLYF